MSEPEWEQKQRIIQEMVPGKQVSLAHIIANPNRELCRQMGMESSCGCALGILTITPSEGAIIGADVATKAADVEIVFLDKRNGSLVIGGDVASVETAVRDVMRVMETLLNFTPTAITYT